MKLVINDDSIEETIENSKMQTSKLSSSRDDVLMKSILRSLKRFISEQIDILR